MKNKLFKILILLLYILTFSQTLNPIPNSINVQKEDVSKSYFEIINNFKINENYGNQQLNSQLEFASIYKTGEEFEDLKTEGLLILMFFTLITVVMIILKAIQLKKLSLENSTNWIEICKQDYYFLLGYSFITSVFNLAFYIYNFSQYGLYNLITIYIIHLPLLIISLNIFKKNTIDKKYIYLIIILIILLLSDNYFGTHLGYI